MRPMQSAYYLVRYDAARIGGCRRTRTASSHSWLESVAIERADAGAVAIRAIHHAPGTHTRAAWWYPGGADQPARWAAARRLPCAATPSCSGSCAYTRRACSNCCGTVRLVCNRALGMAVIGFAHTAEAGQTNRSQRTCRQYLRGRATPRGRGQGLWTDDRIATHPYGLPCSWCSGPPCPDPSLDHDNRLSTSKIRACSLCRHSPRTSARHVCR